MRLNPHKLYPEAYQKLYELSGLVRKGPLDPVIHALVTTRASQIAGCAYCLGLHTDEARSVGVSQRKLDVLGGWRDDGEFTAKERAALALCEEMTRVGDGRRVDDATWAAASAQFSDEELSALLYSIAVIGAWNRLNVATEHPSDG